LKESLWYIATGFFFAVSGAERPEPAFEDYSVALYGIE
jgi:hypothetical protein